MDSRYCLTHRPNPTPFHLQWGLHVIPTASTFVEPMAYESFQRFYVCPGARPQRFAGMEPGTRNFRFIFCSGLTRQAWRKKKILSISRVYIPTLVPPLCPLPSNNHTPFWYHRSFNYNTVF